MGRRRVLREYDVYLVHKRNGNTHKVPGITAFDQAQAGREAVRRMSPAQYSAIARTEVIRKIGHMEVDCCRY